MALVHNLGFPRIGKQRELKYALENYWQGHSDLGALQRQAQALRAKHWQDQVDCDYIPVGDFSLYDHVLDMSFMLGNVPERVSSTPGDSLEKYFRLARGRSLNNTDCHCVRAGEMTKWFDTNYHYIVPELSKDTQFSLRPEALIEQIIEAKALGKNVKPVIIGPVTYLWLSKAKDGSERLDLLDDLLVSYRHLLQALVQHEVEWVQIDEPILVTDLRPQWRRALEKAYAQLKSENIKLLLTTYFGKLEDNLQLACELPADGLHIDTINAKDEVAKVLDWLPVHKVLSLGVVDGRNIWKTDLNKTLSWLQPIAEKLNDRLWLAPSCSLLHVPVDLDCETSLAPEIKNWLAFAVQKLAELKVLCSALNGHCDKVSSALADNAEAITSRVRSHQVHKPEVKQSVAELSADLGRRRNPYSVRSLLQRDRLKLPLFPTTTIGSFPQTQAIRQARLHFKKGKLSKDAYEAQMQSEIARAVAEQEALGLDVLVHGEAERNDMVAYFGEHLEGCAFSSFGWVQSYGSRCVKPPIIFGDVKRPKTITVDWTHYAQSLTEKPMKGMLTGPVTILNWSFVRDDQPRSETCFQLALALREEVLDLERAGLTIIQIDEAALREGLPLRESKWVSYLDWAVESFRICANGVQDKTQIHTHMCYSEFNDIIEAIAHMDADVITIETSRSDMELLDVFNDFNYPNDIGPGVYDIHTPNTPTSEEIVSLMRKAAQRIPIQRLWVNPDCGLKTRRWEEVVPALKAMVDAARVLRASMA